MCLVMVGWVVRNSSAAREKLPSSTSRTNISMTCRRSTSGPEDRLEVRLAVAVVQAHAALDVVQVVEHQLLGARAVALGHRVDDHLLLVVAAALGRGRVVEEDDQA